MQFVVDVCDVLVVQGIVVVIQYYVIEQFGYVLYGWQYFFLGIKCGQWCWQGQEEGDGWGFYGMDVGYVEVVWFYDVGY